MTMAVLGLSQTISHLQKKKKKKDTVSLYLVLKLSFLGLILLGDFSFQQLFVFCGILYERNALSFILLSSVFIAVNVSNKQTARIESGSTIYMP